MGPLEEDGDLPVLGSHESPPPQPPGSLRVTWTTQQCGNGPWDISVAEEAGFRVFTVSTPNTYTAFLGTEQERSMLECEFDGLLQAPEGHAYALAGILTHASAKLDGKVDTTVSLTHVAGDWPRLETRTATVVKNGPYAGGLALELVLPPGTAEWSECGGEHVVEFRATAELKNNYPQGTGTFSLGTGGRTAFELRVAVRPCTTGDADAAR